MPQSKSKLEQWQWILESNDELRHTWVTVNFKSKQLLLFDFALQNNFRPSKHDTFTQCWINVGPSSTTLGQHWFNIGWMSRVCSVFITGRNKMWFYCEEIIILTSPHLPTTSLISLRPSDKSTIHLLTALLLRSGVRSSSAIRTHPSDRTANLMG